MLLPMSLSDLCFNEHLTRSVWPNLCFLFWALVLSPSTHAQAELSAQEHIRRLHESELIFVLPENDAKQKQLRHTLLHDELTPRQRKRLERLLQNSLIEQDSFDRTLRLAVEEAYAFSPYRFVRSDTLQQWLGQQQDDAIFYLVFRGATESGADALLITDESGNVLSRPFPYFARLFRISAFFDTFFGNQMYAWRDLNKVIQKWNDRLQQFYDDTTGP